MTRRFLIIIFLLFFGCQKLPSKLFFGAAVEGLPAKEELVKLQRDVGVSLSIVEFYVDFNTSIEKVVLSLNDIWEEGAIACLTLEPKDTENINCEDLLSNKYDRFLSDLADKLRLFAKPLIIRFAHEMNLDSYHWGGSKGDFGLESPWRCKMMFRYMVNFFKDRKVNNILWAFCPNAESVPEKTSWNNPLNYYPGDQYVDIIGMDGYSGCITENRPFKEIFLPLYKKLVSLKKPIFIFETAVYGDNKNVWIKDAIKTMLDLKILGFIWFWVSKECDWRIYGEELKNHEFSKSSLFQKWAQEEVRKKS